jgi:hypothetical protein
MLISLCSTVLQISTTPRTRTVVTLCVMLVMLRIDELFLPEIDQNLPESLIYVYIYNIYRYIYIPIINPPHMMYFVYIIG